MEETTKEENNKEPTPSPIKTDEKHFSEWIVVKEDLHEKHSFRVIREGEVWWCAVGENVGTEVNGKSELFLRPVIIFKKNSRQDFIGIPLSTKHHVGTWYANFEFKGKEQTALLTQVRHLSVSRLKRKMGDLPENDFNTIRDVFCELIPKPKNTPNYSNN